MKHTPGPWEYTKHATKYPDLFTYNIQQAQPDPDFNRVCGVTSELDSEADARLIAAAPDLLEACKIAANNLRDEVNGLRDESEEDWDYEIETLEQAINKAEGKR